MPPTAYRTLGKTREEVSFQNLMIEQRSVDSFICGFRLAWEMANELNHFETNRHPSPEEEAEMDA